MSTIFPLSASVGQIFDGYTYNGSKWEIIGVDLTADYPEIIAGKISASVIPDTFATKTYVDTGIANIDALPSQSGHSGQFLTTSGSVASWATVDLSSASTAAVAAIVDSAPETLNTLNELAAALGDDANYASTITTALGTKLDVSSASATYLTQVSASTTYAPISSPTFTGTVSGVTKSMVGLGNVENTTLSTWAGSTNITTLGTISNGTWSGTTIGTSKGGTGLTSIGTANQILKVNSGATALEWGSIAGAVYQTDAPAGAAAGTIWVDSDATAGIINSNDFVLKSEAEAYTPHVFLMMGA